MSDTGKQAGRRAPQDRPASRVYWVATIVGLVGAGMLALALRTPSGGSETAIEGSTTDELPPAAGQPGQAGFPARFDSLGMSLGSAEAPVVVREFADYQCPACGSFAPVARQLREEYVEAGRVRFVLFDFPLTDLHPNALVAAQAARCADGQDGYWAMHDALFENQAEWSSMADPVPAFAGYAERIGLNGDVLRNCLETGAELSAVQESAAFARAIGVRSTPTVAVGDQALSGVPTYEQMRVRIEAELEESR